MDEVIVTAQKREENIQDVAISVTALTDRTITALGLTKNVDIAAQTPGLLFAEGRVEVLKGPQGSLFGRNATGGLLHFVTRAPGSESGGYADLQLGEESQLRAEGAPRAAAAPMCGCTSPCWTTCRRASGVHSDPRTRHYLTRNDLLNCDADLYGHATQVLSKQPHHDLHVTNSSRGGKLEIVVKSWNMDWLDRHINGRVLQSRDLVCSGEDRAGQAEFQLSPGTPEDTEIEIHGFRKLRAGGALVARYKHRLTDEGK